MMQVEKFRKLFVRAILFIMLIMLNATGQSLKIEAGGFTIRNSPPATSNKYYYDSNYNANAGSSTYKMPNCTTYVLGRVYEITGKRFNIWGNAGEYYANNSSYACSTNAYEPALGAVVCYSTSGVGHVQVVEEIGEDSGGRYICASESNYGGRDTPSKAFNYMKIYLSDLANSRSTGTVPRKLLEDNDGYSFEQEVNKNFTYAKFQGYIYPDGNNKDTEAPIVTNAYISQYDRDGYTVIATATDNVAVTRLQFPTRRYDQPDGWIWYDGVKNADGTYSYRVNISDFESMEQVYLTEVRASDAAGNMSEPFRLDPHYVDRTAPVITNAYISQYDRDGYTVVATATDNVAVTKVCFPTWTSVNGQDDIDSDWYNNATATSIVGNTYYYRVTASDHNNENGTYITHIYAYDICGNYTKVEIIAEVPTSTPMVLPFTDVPQGSWYYDYVASVYEKGYMVGSGTTFNPAGLLTRAEIVTALYSMNGKPATEVVSNFTDVTSGQWYSTPISWAYRNHIASGYANGKFGTADLITREQFAVMLYQYASSYGYNTAYSDSALSGYADAEAVSSWANTAMKWAVTNQIISGKTAATLDPGGNATRAECATMITKLGQLKNK